MSDHRILTITKVDLDAENFYIGAVDVSDFDGSIEIAADLGRVKFKGGKHVAPSEKTEA